MLEPERRARSSRSFGLDLPGPLPQKQLVVRQVDMDSNEIKTFDSTSLRQDRSSV